MPPPVKTSSDPVEQARREWNRLKVRRRRDPKAVSAKEVADARQRYNALAGIKPRKRKPPARPAATAARQPAAAAPEVVSTELPLALADRAFTAPADAEYAGRLEVFLFLKLGLPRGEEWGVDEDDARQWLQERPALYARVLAFFARRALGDAFREWFTESGPGSREAS